MWPVPERPRASVAEKVMDMAAASATAPPGPNGTLNLASDPTVMPKVWAAYGRSYVPCEKAVSQMPPGHYVVRHSPEKGIHFYQKDVKTDELLVLPDSESEAIIAGIEKFWTKEEHYRAFKMLWKRGVLLWGAPGSGKTSTVQIMANKIVERGGLVIYVESPIATIQGLDILRYIEPKRPIVVVLEDLDGMVKQHGESDLLSLLDGEFQVDNAVFVATTNYPDELDQRIINRPSRFDIVKEIHMPSPEARAVFLKTKNPHLTNDELDQWVGDTDGYSIAHLKELISAVEILELPYEGVLQRLDEMISGKATEESDRATFGFHGKNEGG